MPTVLEMISIDAGGNVPRGSELGRGLKLLKRFNAGGDVDKAKSLTEYSEKTEALAKKQAETTTTETTKAKQRHYVA